jgi:hypothetical protein
MKGIKHTTLPAHLKALALGIALGVCAVGFQPLAARASDAGEKPGGRKTSDEAKTDRAGPQYKEVRRVPVAFEQVRGIATDAENRIYVCGDRAVLIMDPEGKPHSRVPFEEPAWCIAVGGNRLLYIGMRDHVQVLDASGLRKATWAGLGEEAIVTSIATFGNEIYIADAGNRMVMRFDRGGRLLGIIGRRNENGDGGFVIRRPFFDIAAAADGTLWVVNTGRYRLERYTSQGVFIKSWGFFSEAIEGFCGCCNPTHIALLRDGSVVTSEKEIVRVKVYNPDGTLVGLVAGPDSFEEMTVGLDLAVDSSGRILVLDPKRRSVRIFEETHMERP